MKNWLILLCLVVCGALLLTVVAEMPPIGDPNNPTNSHIVPRYISQGEKEAGCKNIVTAIILNYRGYDTMGEVTVIFTALCSVLAILRRENLKISYSELDISPVKASIIVSTILCILVPCVMLFAIYVILFGTSSPGGGFQGGVIAGAGFIIVALIFGLTRGIRKFPLRIRGWLEPAAVISFTVVGLTGILLGGNFLTFMPPYLPLSCSKLACKIMLSVLEIGIGVGGGSIMASIFYSMQREDRQRERSK